jgi:hypothetical protein
MEAASKKAGRSNHGEILMGDKCQEMEAASKKKHGRPNAFSEEFRDLYVMVLQLGGKSERQIQTSLYAQMAVNLLVDGDAVAPEYHFIFNGENNTFKVGILCELGRLYMGGYCDEDGLRQHARELCESKTKTNDAIALLRSWRRTGRKTSGSDLGLAIVISKAINAYIARHPDTTQQQVEGAIEHVQDWMRDIDE